MASRGLYTPEILAAAMTLTQFPWDDAFGRKGSARSRSCGSTIEMGLTLDAQGRITTLGIRPHACAVGQAAASLFARNAIGLDAVQIATARDDLATWLSDDGNAPDWPEIDLLASARTYPARHGAILLAWDAALDALS